MAEYMALWFIVVGTLAAFSIQTDKSGYFNSLLVTLTAICFGFATYIGSIQG